VSTERQVQAGHIGASDARFIDSHGFLTERVTRYLGTLAVFFSVFSVSGWVKAVVFREHLPSEEVADVLVSGSWLLTTIAALLVAGWVFTRRARRSVRLLHGIELTGTLLCVVAVAHILRMVPSDVIMAAPPEVGVTLLALLVLVLRAALVPSTALLTGVVGALVTAELTAVSIMRIGLPHLELGHQQIWLYVMTWGAIFTVATVIVSQVIYGLHQRVRKAIQLGNYTLSAKLGEGGMGEVYLAHHALLRKPTAIKLLPPEKAGETTIKRFEREVREASRLVHPNTVDVFDFGRTPQGVFYYAMEFLDGLNLEELIALYGPQPPGRVVYVLAQVAHALEHAHSQGLIHRDIKPANIVLCDRGGVADMAKVVDFGLVKDVDADDDVQLTGTNTVTGTPAYMSPESLTNPEAIDGRADLYALGAVGYFMLTGEPVFGGHTLVEICGHHLHSEPEPPSLRSGTPVSEDLDAILLRCLAKKPDDRFSSGAELRRALLACEAAPAWSMDEGEVWWAAHRGEVQEMVDSKRVDVSTANTVLVARLSA
jgi:serine/threonine-protein kinase